MKGLELTIACAREHQRREVQDVLDRDDQQHVDLFHYSINTGFQNIFCPNIAHLRPSPLSMLMLSKLEELFEAQIMFSHTICLKKLSCRLTSFLAGLVLDLNPL